jgi:hypothetical protein
VTAQQIRGVVRDDASHVPVAGAVVFLLSSTDSSLARTLSDTRGRFSLMVVGTPTRLRVVRIGYQPTFVRLTGSDSIDVPLRRLPLMLDTVRRAERNDCPTGHEASRAVAMWEQARTAFLAASISREADPPAIRLVRFDRVARDPTLPKFYVRRIPDVSTQTVRTIDGMGTRVFASARSAGDAAAQGYMVGDANGYTLYPPDEQVLIDDSFFRSHCFEIERDAAQHSGRIGIVFKPMADRDGIVDLRGTLWIDSTMAALRVLEFAFTNLPPASQSKGQAGGLLVFEDAPSGVPLLVEWSLRQPGPLAGAGYQYGTAKIGYFARSQLEAGAQLVRAEWKDGTSWVAPLGAMAGTVIDPKTRRPVANVPVALLNAGRNVRTDTMGRFTFEELIDGPYRLAVDDTLTALFFNVVNADRARLSWLRSPELGIERTNDDASPLVRVYSVRPDSNPPITIELPSIEDAFRRSCGKQIQGDSTGALAVWILSRGIPAPSTQVTARWQTASMPVERTVKSDDQGRAIICGAPRDQTVSVSTFRDGGARTQTDVTIGPKRLVALVIIQR